MHILSLGTIFFLSPDVSLRAFSFPCLTSYGSLPLLLPLVVDGRASQLRLTLSPHSAVRGTFFPDMATHDTDVSRCPPRHGGRPCLYVSGTGANVTAMQARLPDDRKNVASIMPAST